MKKKILLGIVGIIVFFAVVSAIGGNKQNQSSTQQATTTGTQQKQEPQKATEQVAKIGEAVEDSDLAFTVTNVETAKTLGNQFTSRDAQGIFYIVTLKAENKGKSTKTIDSSMLTLIDDQGRKFERSVEGQVAKGLAQGRVDLFLQQVQPGLSITGDIIFDAPKDDTGLKLVVKGSLFGSGKKIDIGK